MTAGLRRGAALALAGLAAAGCSAPWTLVPPDPLQAEIVVYGPLVGPREAPVLPVRRATLRGPSASELARAFDRLPPAWGRRAECAVAVPLGTTQVVEILFTYRHGPAVRLRTLPCPLVGRVDPRGEVVDRRVLTPALRAELQARLAGTAAD